MVLGVLGATNTKNRMLILRELSVSLSGASTSFNCSDLDFDEIQFLVPLVPHRAEKFSLPRLFLTLSYGVELQESRLSVLKCLFPFL